jgi:hypothetical protein
MYAKLQVNTLKKNKSTKMGYAKEKYLQMLLIKIWKTRKHFTEINPHSSSCHSRGTLSISGNMPKLTPQ